MVRVWVRLVSPVFTLTRHSRYTILIAAFSIAGLEEGKIKLFVVYKSGGGGSPMLKFEGGGGRAHPAFD